MPVNERDQFVRQIDALVASKELHGADSLCKLLRYLANHALELPGEPVKEYKIATEVFGRSSDFDPQLDSIIRVQAVRGPTRPTGERRRVTRGTGSPRAVGATEHGDVCSTICDTHSA